MKEIKKENWYVIGYQDDSGFVYSNSQDGMVYSGEEKEDLLADYNKLQGYCEIREYLPFNHAFAYGEIICSEIK